MNFKKLGFAFSFAVSAFALSGASPIRAQAADPGLSMVTIYQNPGQGGYAKLTYAVVRQARNAELYGCISNYSGDPQDQGAVYQFFKTQCMGAINSRTFKPESGVIVRKSYLMNGAAGPQRLVVSQTAIWKDIEQVNTDAATFTVDLYGASSLRPQDSVQVMTFRITHDRLNNPVSTNYRQSFSLVGFSQVSGLPAIQD